VGGHSLGQLWAIDDTYGPTEYSDVETGWIKWSGCSNTNFFVYHFDKGQPTGYSREFVQVSNKQVPSTGCGNGTSEGTDDTWHEYGIHRYEENWWVYHDGEWIGYYPKSAFPLYMFYGLLVGEAGGEVGEPSWDYYPYTQMGNGQAGDSDTAAMFKEVWREKSNGAESTYLTLATPYETEACRYSLGHFHELGKGDFRYGGPGWTVGGSCPTGQ
jgi:Neprosin